MAGPVVVQMVPGRSAIDAYLASLRSAGITVPVNFVPAGTGFVGPNGQPAGNGPTTPNTFGSPGNTYINAAQQFASSSFGPGTNNSFLSSASTMTAPGNLIGSLPGMAGMISPAQVAAQYAGPSGSAGMAGPQLGQAASQMLQAAQLMVQAAGGSQAVGGAPSAGVRQFQQLKAEEREYKATSARVDRNWEAVQLAQQKQADRLALRAESEPADEEGSVDGSRSTRAGRPARNPLTRSFRGILPRYSALGFIAYQLYRTGEAALEKETSDALSDREFGEGSPSAAIARARSTMEFAERAVPFSGILLHSQIKRQKLDIANAEDAIKDNQTYRGIEGGNLVADAEQRSAKYHIESFKDFGDERRRDEIHESARQFADAGRARLFAEKKTISTITNERERGRQTAILDAKFVNQFEAERSRNELADVEDADQRRDIGIRNAGIDRSLGIRNADIQGRFSGLELRASGQYGLASRADFYAGMDARQRAANEQLGLSNQRRNPGSQFVPVVDPVQKRENELAGIGFEAESLRATADRNSETSGIMQQLARNPVAAAMAASQLSRLQELRTSKGSEDTDSINARYDAADSLRNQGFGDRTDSLAYRQGARNESLGIALHASDPRLGGIMAGANDVARSAEMQSRSIFENSGIDEARKQGLSDQALQGGVMQLQLQQANYARDFQPQELDSINQQATSGPGTANSGEALNAMAADVKALEALLGQALPAITAALAPLAGVKS